MAACVDMCIAANMSSVVEQGARQSGCRFRLLVFAVAIATCAAGCVLFGVRAKVAECPVMFKVQLSAPACGFVTCAALSADS